MTVEKELLEILCCPNCKGTLKGEEHSLVCVPCGLKYPVREGIPVLIVEEAEKL